MISHSDRSSASISTVTDTVERLKQLGQRYKQLNQEMEQIKPDLHDAMRAARAAGMTYREIMELSGYKTIQQVRTICGADGSDEKR